MEKGGKSLRAGRISPLGSLPYPRGVALLVSLLCFVGAGGGALADPIRRLADPASCLTAGGEKPTVPGVAYNFQLQSPDGAHHVAMITCAALGAPSEGQTFTLYDLNGASLSHNDRVVLAGPHGLLLGLDNGQLKPNRTEKTGNEEFTILSKKGKGTIEKGDRIYLQAADGTYLEADGGGGGLVGAGGGKGASARFRVGKLSKTLKSRFSNLTGGGKSSVTAVDLETCKSTRAWKELQKLPGKKVEVPGRVYLVQIRTSTGKHKLALTSCKGLGAPAVPKKASDAYKFTLYDLNEGILEGGDRVVLEAGNGLLLGLDPGGQLVADRWKYATREVFRIKKVSGAPGKAIVKNDQIALVTHDGKRYVMAVGNGGAEVQAGPPAQAELASPKSTETFLLSSLSRTKAAKIKNLALKGVKALANQIAKLVVKQTMGDEAARKYFGKDGEEKDLLEVKPKACAQDLAQVVVPLEDDEREAAQADGQAGAESSPPDGKIKSALRWLWRKIDKAQSCGGIHFEATIPGTDLTLKAFYTRRKGRATPLWNLAFFMGDETLNDNPITRALPALQEVLGDQKVERLVAILSEDQATVALEELGPDLRAMLEDHQNATEIPGMFRSTRVEEGTITFQQGVNLFGEVEGPRKGALATLSEAILPGSTRSEEPWRVSGVVGTDFLMKVLARFSSFERKEARSFEGKSALSLDLWIPGYTPFPFHLLRNKKALHAEILRSRLTFDLSRKKKSGKESRALEVSAKSWNKYWVLREDKPFPIVCEGHFTFEDKKVSGEMEGFYEIDAANDPLGFLPDVHLTKLRVGGAFQEKKAQQGEKEKLSFQIASQVKVGEEVLDSTFELIVKRKGGETQLGEIRLSLGSEDEGGRIDLGKLGMLSKIPMIDEFVLEKTVFGLKPTKGPVPDFYITGGGTWTRTNMGGQLAIMKKKKDFFLFTRGNDFTLAGLLPRTPEFDKPRGVLTALKMPKTLLLFTTHKGGELSLGDIPEPLQPMFEGLTQGKDPRVPVKGDGLTLVAGLDFTQAENEDIRRGFQQLGISQFGPQGPLLISGSIGGLQQNKPSLALAATLPAFQFPETIGGKTNPIAEILEPKGVDFFLDLVAKGAPKVELGIRGDLVVHMPRLDDFHQKDKLDLNGSLFLKASSEGEIGVALAGGMKGRWQNPMGIENLAFQDAAITMGVGVVAATQALSIDYGLGGTTIFTVEDSSGASRELLLETDMLIGAGLTPKPPFVTPTKLGLNLGVTELTPDAAIRVADSLMKGVLVGEMPKQIVKGLPPGDPLRKAIETLQEEIVGTSLPDLLKLDRLPLPLLELEPAEGNEKIKLYFATPGASIPGREDSGLDGLGFSVAGAGNLRFLGRSQDIGEMDLTLNARDGLRIFGRIPAFSVEPAHFREGKLDIKASSKELPYFKIDGGVKVGDFLDDETDIELSKDKISFRVRKHYGDVLVLDVDVHTEGKDLKSTKKLFVSAIGVNNLSDFARDHVLPALGVPKPVVESLVHGNPLDIRRFKVEGEIGVFTGADPIDVYLEPVYFGDTGAMKPVSAKVKGKIDWKAPQKNLLLGHELTRAMAENFLGYLMENPKQTRACNLGLLKLEPGYLGGDTVALKNKHGKKIEKKVFHFKGGLKLLASKPELDMKFSGKHLQAVFTDHILGGLVEARYEVNGSMKNGHPDSLTLTGVATGDLNEWLRDKVVSKVAKGVIGKKISQAIEKADLVTVEKGVIAGDFQDFFGKGGAAQLTLTTRVLGKYQDDPTRRYRVRHLEETIPVYAGTKHLEESLSALEKPIVEIVGILVDDATRELTGLSLREVEEKAEKVGRAIIGGAGKVYQAARKAFDSAARALRLKGEKYDLAEDDWVHIVSEKYGECVQAQSGQNKAQFQLAPCDPTNHHQQFGIIQGSTQPWKLFVVRSSGSTRCMDGRDGKDYTAVHEMNCRDTDYGQQWFMFSKLEKLESTDGSGSPRSRFGPFPLSRIHPWKGGDNCLFYRTGTNLGPENCTGDVSQRFFLTGVGAKLPSAPIRWSKVSGKALDVSVGGARMQRTPVAPRKGPRRGMFRPLPVPQSPSAVSLEEGDVWVVGTDHQSYQWVDEAWRKVPSPARLIRIDVDSNKDVWAVDETGGIWKSLAGKRQWTRVPGPEEGIGARDIGVGGGIAWVVSTDHVEKGNFAVYRRDPSGKWERAQGAAARLDVDPKGEAIACQSIIAGSTGQLITWEGLAVRPAVPGNVIDVTLSNGPTKSPGQWFMVAGIEGLPFRRQGNVWQQGSAIDLTKPIFHLSTDGLGRLWAVDNENSIYHGVLAP